MEEHILVAHAAMLPTALRIVEAVPNITLGRLDWQRFGDTMPNLFVHDLKRFHNANVSYLMSLDSTDKITEGMMALRHIMGRHPRNLKVLLPYFPMGTMERVDHLGQIPSAKYLAEDISEKGRGGVIYTWDIHTLQNVEYFDSRIVTVEPRSSMKMVRKMLQAGQYDCVCFPDEGAFKRFHRMFEDENGKALWPIIICRKDRFGTSRKVYIVEGDPTGMRVIIVDDLIHTGGTLVACKDALKAASALTVSVFAPHGVLEENSWQKFIGTGFEEVHITDSHPTYQSIPNNGVFKVHHLTSALVEAILE